MTKYFFAGIGLATLFLGFGPLSIQTQKHLFHTLSFYLICSATLVWFWTLIPKTLSRPKIKPHLPAFLMALLFIVTIFLISPPHLRILYDETNLLGISQAMLEQHACYIPTQAIFENQQNHFIAPEWGIRPFAFPFFLYLIHLTKGYALSNVFILNALAGFCALFLFYLLLQKYVTKPLAILGMGLLSAYPIFVLWTTSGGFEIANLAFALFAFYHLHNLLTIPKAHHTTRLIFTLVLLAQIRYEAVLFIFALAPAVLYYTIKHPHTRPHKITLIAPLLLLPIAWQRTLYSGDYAFMVQQGDAMFGIHHFFTNIQQAVSFFASTQPEYGTLPYLFYITLAGTLIGLIHLIQKRATTAHTTHLFFLTIGLAFILQSVTILSYSLGNLTRPFSLRLGIIFLPFILIPILYLCHRLTNKKPMHIPLALITCLFIYYGWSHTQTVSAHHLQLSQINRAYTDFFHQQDPQKQTLIISPHARLFVPHQRSAVTFQYANQNWPSIITHFQNKMFNKIFVCQIVDAQKHTLTEDTRLKHNVPLIPFGELQIGNEFFIISQIVHTK